jgi:UPF0716 family protein affecting phage T7 exclusion
VGISEIGLICAVAGLALLAIFGLPEEQETMTGADSGTVAPSRMLEQVVALAGVALLVAAGFFQAGTLW